MPLHLDLHSRRRFLGGSAVLALSSFFPASRGATAEREHWALLSDTHIAADPALKSRQGINMADHLKKVLGEVLAEKETLSGVIIDGDCAYNTGQPGDYATLLGILDPLREAGLPVHFSLGNHDDREVFSAALGEATGQSPVVGKHCTLIETPLVNWILLDSLRFVNKVEGELGSDQLAWVDKLLAANPNKPTLLIGHHYPETPRSEGAPGDAEAKVSGLVDSKPFLDLITRHSAAKAFIYGHSHNWHLKKGEGAPHQINLPPTSYVFNPSLPSGWVRAALSATGMSLELRTLDPSHPKHGETHELAWR